MDLFGSEPNLKCNNKAACYSVTASLFSYNSTLQMDNFQRVLILFLLDTKCYSA